ncbi:MAG: hypothetical protein ACPGVO_17345 [Spirulinaceae cyanobacterium]
MKQYIEVKAKENIYPSEAKLIIVKGTIAAVMTMGTISPNSKEMFDAAGILWVEQVPEQWINESDAKKLEL